MLVYIFSIDIPIFFHDGLPVALRSANALPASLECCTHSSFFLVLYTFPYMHISLLLIRYTYQCVVPIYVCAACIYIFFLSSSPYNSGFSYDSSEGLAQCQITMSRSFKWAGKVPKESARLRRNRPPLRSYRNQNCTVRYYESSENQTVDARNVECSILW